jgi:hypothetical protein
MKFWARWVDTATPDDALTAYRFPLIELLKIQMLSVLVRDYLSLR